MVSLKAYLLFAGLRPLPTTLSPHRFSLQLHSLRCSLSEINTSLARRSPEILPGTAQVPTVSHQHLGLSCIHLPHHQVQVWATAFSLVCTAPMLCCCHSPRLRLSALSLPCQVWGAPLAQVLINFLARHWALERRAHSIYSGTSACPADLGPMVGAKQQCLLTQTWAGSCTSKNHTAYPFTFFSIGCWLPFSTFWRFQFGP